MNITYTDKEQVEDYDPALWNAQDANEVKNAVNSKADLTALAAKADVSALSTKADVSALNNKADKVNGVVPVSQLPEAILNTNQFEVLSDGTIGIKTSYLQSLGLTTGGGTNSTNPGDTNTTPAAPTLSSDDTTNVLIASHALGNSEIVVSTNGSSYNPYTGTISVGDVARAAGFWKFKIKAATGRNESPVVNSPAFTIAQTGNTTPSAPTNGVVNDSQNTFGFTLVNGIALSGNYEYTLNGGTSVANVTVNPIPVGNVAIAAGQVGVRVKAASGRNASAWLFSTAAFTATGGAPYVVEKTVRINFNSQWAGDFGGGTPYWNYLKASNTQLAAADGFVSNALLADDNSSTSITLKNSGAFSASVGEIVAAQTTAGETGVFANAIVNSAWTLNTGAPAAITLDNLNPAKFYQLYFLMPVAISGSTVRKVTINGVSKTKTSTSLLASFGTVGNGLADNEWIVYNNVTGASIAAAFGKDSGDYQVNLACMVIEESNVAKP